MSNIENWRNVGVNKTLLDINDTLDLYNPLQTLLIKKRKDFTI